MKRLTTALAASLAALAVSAGSAFAAGPPVQSATQSSGTDQAAIAASSATQVEPVDPEHLGSRVESWERRIDDAVELRQLPGERGEHGRHIPERDPDSGWRLRMPVFAAPAA